MAGNSGTNMNVRRTILAPALFLAALLLEVPFAVHAAPLADTAEIRLTSALRGRFPSNWAVVPVAPMTWHGERKGPDGDAELDLIVHVEKHGSHADALKRLSWIEAEYPASSNYVLIGGWPALERKVVVRLHRPGEDDGPDKKQGKSEPRKTDQPGVSALRTTTAVAVGKMVVRYEAMLQPNAPAMLADEALVIGRSLRLPAAPAGAAQSLSKLKSGALRPPALRPTAYAPTASGGSASPVPYLAAGGAVQLPGGSGEIDTAVSGNGTAMMAVASCGVFFSANSGASFTPLSVPTLSLNNDCSVTWGKSGAFYIGRLGAQMMGVFTLPASQVSAPSPVISAPVLAVDWRGIGKTIDQPHIAADRWNLSNQNADRVYVVWHGYDQFSSFLACSADGGVTWPIEKWVCPTCNTSYPRVTVAPDGMVYVVSRSSDSVFQIDKFSSCDQGLVEQPRFPVYRNIYGVQCPLPGLDRCNDGNWLSSPTIAVDEAGIVYLGWAQSFGTAEEIWVVASKDGGETFPFGPAVLNSWVLNARRYMPWLTAWNQAVYAGWYDRRNAATSRNDLTRYFVGNATWVNGTLTPGAETDLSGADDPQCASGFPAGVRSAADCTSCIPNLPCQRVSVCGSCGSPKYGDYNSLSSGGFLLLNVWASAAAPTGLPAPGGITAYATVSSLCTSGGPACGGTCCEGWESCLSPGVCCNSHQVCNGVCCNSQSTCGGGGIPGVCGCTPLSPEIACQTSCGTVSDNCGGNINCGACKDGLVCYYGQCLSRHCVPKHCQRGWYWDAEECACRHGPPQ